MPIEGHGTGSKLAFQFAMCGVMLWDLCHRWGSSCCEVCFPDAVC
jgi:hypothetical protein